MARLSAAERASLCCEQLECVPRLPESLESLEQLSEQSSAQNATNFAYSSPSSFPNLLQLPSCAHSFARIPSNLIQLPNFDLCMEERAAPLLADPAVGRGGRPPRRNPRSGGVLRPRDAKGCWAVNIRPKCWGDKDKQWWGRLKSQREAEWISDIANHYFGFKPVYQLFPGDGLPPPFANPKFCDLGSVDERMQYVMRIAKGEEHQELRKEFSRSVKEMVKLLMQEIGCRDDLAAAATMAAAAAVAETVEEIPWDCFGGEELRLPPEFSCFGEEDAEYMMDILGFS